MSIDRSTDRFIHPPIHPRVYLFPLQVRRRPAHAASQVGGRGEGRAQRAGGEGSENGDPSDCRFEGSILSRTEVSVRDKIDPSERGPLSSPLEPPPLGGVVTFFGRQHCRSGLYPCKHGRPGALSCKHRRRLRLLCTKTINSGSIHANAAAPACFRAKSAPEMRWRVSAGTRPCCI